MDDPAAADGGPGVANVAIWGQRDRQLQVLVDPDRLQAHGVTLDEVVRAAGEAVALEAGGFVDTPNQRLAVRTPRPSRTASDLEAIVVASRNGAALRLGDVATVVEGFPPPIGDAIINDGPGLLLIVEKQPGANTLEVTRDVEAGARAALKPALGGRRDRPDDLPPGDVHRAVAAEPVAARCSSAASLVDPRPAGVPVRLAHGADQPHGDPAVAARRGLVLHYRGGTINTMVLAGLVIALGEVVDDAIIDVENIVRRLRLNRQSDTRSRPSASCSTRRWKCAARSSTPA